MSNSGKRAATRVAALAALAAAGAGCAQAPVGYNQRVYYDHWPSFFAQGPNYEVPLAVVGNPFATPIEGTERAVSEEFTEALNWAGWSFSTEPVGLVRGRPYAVVMFNLPLGPYGTPCEDTSRARAKPPAAVIVVQAALCLRGIPLVRADATTAGLAGADDPAFRRLMSDIAIDLFRPPIRSGVGREPT